MVEGRLEEGNEDLRVVKLEEWGEELKDKLD